MDKNDLSATMVGASAWLVLSEGIGNFQRASEKSQIHTKIGKNRSKTQKMTKKRHFSGEHRNGGYRDGERHRRRQENDESVPLESVRRRIRPSSQWVTRLAHTTGV